MLRLSLTIAALAALSTPVLAQQEPPRAPSPPPDSRGPGDLERHMALVRHAEMAEFEAFRNSATGHNLGSQPLERVDLANRVSTLMELGRCAEARAMANEAGDRLMAIRVRQLCRSTRNRSQAN